MTARAKTMNVKPGPSRILDEDDNPLPLRVRYPYVPGVAKQTLPPEGASVPRTTYWNRRLRCGDVVLVGGEAKKAAPKKTASK